MYRSPSWYGQKAGIGTWEFGSKASEGYGRFGDWHAPSWDWIDWESIFDSWRSKFHDYGHPWHPCGGHHGRDKHPPKIQPEHEFSVIISDLEDGLELGDLKARDNRGIEEFRIQSGNPDTDGDGTKAFAIDKDGTLRVTDHHDVDFGADGQIQLTVTAHDAAGNQSDASLVTLTAAPDPLIPTNTPFNYHIGINYESWQSGRADSYSISADLDQITQYFKLIKTYHAAAVGTADPTNPIIDDTQKQVIDYAVGTTDVELVMGTANSALAQGGFGAPWAAGLMTDKAYTDKWVQMLIDTFGSTANVEKHLKAILLGNEIDANGPPPNDPSFNDYLGWINTSFDNLKASLSDAGLGMIAVSTTIANYGSTNAVSVLATQHINDNWSAAWNNGSPFVLYNQYTQDNMQSTDFEPVENYFELVKTEVPAGLEVFIGETGYSTTSGSANPAQDQATVYQTIFDWLDGMDGQQGNGGPMVPMFPFVAFDRPSAFPSSEVGFGIFGEDANSQPTGLKPDLAGIVPDWTADPITPPAAASLALTSDESSTSDVQGVDQDDEPSSGWLPKDGERDTFEFAKHREDWRDHCGDGHDDKDGWPDRGWSKWDDDWEPWSDAFPAHPHEWVDARIDAWTEHVDDLPVPDWFEPHDGGYIW